MPLFPLLTPGCRASRSAGRPVSAVVCPRSYTHSAEEWGSGATMTQHHAGNPPGSSASEAAGRSLEHCAAGAFGRSVACPCRALHMAGACSACHILLGATGQMSYPGTGGGCITSRNTARACGRSSGVHLYALHTGPRNRRHSLRTL